ncbi:hypothetical protein EDB83DRAFT_924444 [Lactarius deliciosus]|nr:hypothetical protein EDB83DRAFT_924444 [Lactarius deliciosus]
MRSWCESYLPIICPSSPLDNRYSGGLYLTRVVGVCRCLPMHSGLDLSRTLRQNQASLRLQLSPTASANPTSTSPALSVSPQTPPDAVAPLAVLLPRLKATHGQFAVFRRLTPLQSKTAHGQFAYVTRCLVITLYFLIILFSLRTRGTWRTIVYSRSFFFFSL